MEGTDLDSYRLEASGPDSCRRERTKPNDYRLKVSVPVTYSHAGSKLDS